MGDPGKHGRGLRGVNDGCFDHNRGGLAVRISW
jgi:hypothetical protein